MFLSNVKLFLWFSDFSGNSKNPRRRKQEGGCLDVITSLSLDLTRSPAFYILKEIFLEAICTTKFHYHCFHILYVTKVGAGGDLGEFRAPGLKRTQKNARCEYG